jgi:DHA1 family tetracycline resistance protein-like MFS transporter
MASPSPSRSRLGVIFLTVLIDLIGFGILLPILPYYAQKFGARGLTFGVLVGSYSAVQFFATAILGRLSDRTGRRPILLATMVINAAGYLLFAFAGSYWALLLSRLVAGFGGGNISVAQAYIADITTAEDRSKGMGVIGAAFGLGFIIGPAIGGLAGHYLGHAAPGLLAAGLSLLNLVLAWRILPESLHEEHRVRRDLFGLSHIGEALGDRRLRALMIVWFIAPFAFSGYSTVLPLYAAARFHWTAKDLGWLFTIVGLTAAVVQGWAFGKLTRRFGDRAMLIAGCLGMAAGIAVIPFARTPAALYGWTVLLAFGNSIANPALSGMVSVLAGAAEQGAVLGAAQALSALGRLSGPEVLGDAYDRGGALVMFLGAGAVMLVAMGFGFLVPRKSAGAS